MTFNENSNANSTDEERIKGVIEHITYVNEENGYTVCKISREDVQGKNELVTLVGIMPMVKVGETLSCVGKWGFHRSFGRQFEVKYFEKQLPSTTSSILAYLSAGTVKGIGPKRAVKIVGAFGESTFEVIEKDPQRLAEISGISKAKAMEISESFKEQFGVRTVMMFCREYFGPATSMKIYKRWGGASVDVMKENPYLLCDEISGISFSKADTMAKNMGMEDNSPLRIRAGILYSLNNYTHNSGSTIIPKRAFIKQASELLEVTKEECADAVDVLEYKNKIAVQKFDNKEYIELKKYYDEEIYIKQKLDLIEETCGKIDAGKIGVLIDEAEKRTGIVYEAMQRKAIEHSLSGGVLILTGGPGTGKTTVVKGIIELFKQLGKTFALAAPTGRAAKRMSEATGEEARTVHRLLEMTYTDGKEPNFLRCESNPIDEELIIIDEASMLDTSITCALLKAIHTGSRLILIGDKDQLASVGAGNVLGDILFSDRYRTVILKKIFRQAGESLIVTNAHAINSGEEPELNCKTNDFFFLERRNETDIANTVSQLCVDRLPKKYGRDLFGKIQVISPSHKGEAGTDSLNILLQKAINPPSDKKREKKHMETVFREGDRVMQIKNDYDITWIKEGEDGCGIFNGDIGIILSVLDKDECLLIDFEGRLTKYDFALLDELELAYAITVHKSQGSEYPFVVMPVFKCSLRLLTRNLLYTAVTRAQTMVILVGDSRVVNYMVMNNCPNKRLTGLKYMLDDPDDEFN